MSFDEMPFKSNPNFRFQEAITNKSDCLSGTCQFDCYKDKNGEVILISPYFDIARAVEKDHHIALINLKNNEVVRKLEAHKNRVTTVRYFQDPETKDDYFISADAKYKVIVWDLTNNCEKKLETELKYEGFIYSCLLLFINKKMYAVVSSLGSNSITRVIDVANKDNVKEITESKELIVYFLAHWVNENATDNDSKNVIIQCAKNKILFSEFPKNHTYHKIETDDKFPYIQAGIVFKNQGKDMFAASITYGKVLIVDLASKTTVKEITMEDDVHLYSFVRWNDHYLLLNDCLQKRIIVFDMLDGYKIKSKVLCPEMNFERFIKKVVHPKYGESLLSVGIDWTVKLFVNRNILKSDA